MKALTMFTAAVWLTIAIPISVAEAGHLACGDVITTNTTLDADLICADGVDGLIIDGVNITVDLGAHTIAGPSGLASPNSSGLTISSGSMRVTVRNGVIDGFDQGVSAYDVRNLILDNLVIRDQLTSHGIVVIKSRNVVIKNSSLFGPDRTPVDPFNVGIELDNVAGIDVRNVNVHGYHRGLSVDCNSGHCLQAPNSGKIRNSNFFGGLQGVTIDATSNMRVTGNQISACIDLDYFPCTGLAVAFQGLVRNLRVENNYIHGMRNGIDLNGILNEGTFVTDSIFSSNHIANNIDSGILVQHGVTGNVIRDNILFDNGNFDLDHDVDSTGNTWINNSCETKFGADIPDCTPAIECPCFDDIQIGTVFQKITNDFTPGLGIEEGEFHCVIGACNGCTGGINPTADPVGNTCSIHASAEHEPLKIEPRVSITNDEAQACANILIDHCQ
jgi:hypothetical protein